MLQQQQPAAPAALNGKDRAGLSEATLTELGHGVAATMERQAGKKAASKKKVARKKKPAEPDALAKSISAKLFDCHQSMWSLMDLEMVALHCGKAHLYCNIVTGLARQVEGVLNEAEHMFSRDNPAGPTEQILGKAIAGISYVVEFAENVVNIEKEMEVESQYAEAINYAVKSMALRVARHIDATHRALIGGDTDAIGDHESGDCL